VASREAIIECVVHGLNVTANPRADGDAALQMMHYINHVWFK
jgi:hypothetical protein